MSVGIPPIAAGMRSAEATFPFGNFFATNTFTHISPVRFPAVTFSPMPMPTRLTPGAG